MPAMNYAEATGVRARTDLSANARPGTREGAMTDEELDKVANVLGRHAREGTTFTLVPTLSGRLCEAILEVLNRRGDHP